MTRAHITEVIYDDPPSRAATLRVLGRTPEEATKNAQEASAELKQERPHTLFLRPSYEGFDYHLKRHVCRVRVILGPDEALDGVTSR